VKPRHRLDWRSDGAFGTPTLGSSQKGCARMRPSRMRSVFCASVSDTIVLLTTRSAGGSGGNWVRGLAAQRQFSQPPAGIRCVLGREILGESEGRFAFCGTMQNPDLQQSASDYRRSRAHKSSHTSAPFSRALSIATVARAAAHSNGPGTQPNARCVGFEFVRSGIRCRFRFQSMNVLNEVIDRTTPPEGRSSSEDRACEPGDMA
jgi:hypothetical protein